LIPSLPSPTGNFILPHFFKRGEEHSISIFYFVFLLTKEVSSDF
jgi:hypothetical protein